MIRRHHKAGVSQLELLISLAVFGLIAVGLANALGFHAKSVSRQSERIAFTDQQILVHDLRRYAAHIPVEPLQNEEDVKFIGTSKSLEFLTSFSADVDLQDLQDLRKISLRYSPLSGLKLIENDPQGVTRERVFGEDISEFRIRYYGLKSGEIEEEWHRTWDDPLRLPKLVKITWRSKDQITVPITLIPAQATAQSEMSASSLVPPS